MRAGSARSPRTPGVTSRASTTHLINRSDYRVVLDGRNGRRASTRNGSGVAAFHRRYADAGFNPRGLEHDGFCGRSATRKPARDCDLPGSTATGRSASVATDCRSVSAMTNRRPSMPCSEIRSTAFRWGRAACWSGSPSGSISAFLPARSRREAVVSSRSALESRACTAPLSEVGTCRRATLQPTVLERDSPAATRRSPSDSEEARCEPRLRRPPRVNTSDGMRDPRFLVMLASRDGDEGQLLDSNSSKRAVSSSSMFTGLGRYR